MVEDMFEVR